jgi:membrane-associated phospholipid phosphatase
MFIWGPPGTLPTFARAFGYMNITAVLIQMVFPCSPPWYENTYGLAPANYSIHGDAAGLKAMDRILGFDMYTSAFQASPVVFGAFPSLHSGWATLETLFMGHVFPRLFPVYVFYTMWLWWSTMYLQHHYAVDLVAGSLRKSTSKSTLPKFVLTAPSCRHLLLLRPRQLLAPHPAW